MGADYPKPQFAASSGPTLQNNNSFLAKLRGAPQSATGSTLSLAKRRSVRLEAQQSLNGSCNSFSDSFCRMSLSFGQGNENANFSTSKSVPGQGNVLISNFSSQKKQDPRLQLQRGSYDIDIYTGFDRLAREEESSSGAVTRSKQMEYRVWDYLEKLDMKVVDFKSFIEDSMRVS